MLLWECRDVGGSKSSMFFEIHSRCPSFVSAIGGVGLKNRCVYVHVDLQLPRHLLPAQTPKKTPSVSTKLL